MTSDLPDAGPGEGGAFVASVPTGLFCRRDCPASRPAPGDCSFHPSAAACIERGFRPCTACRPLGDLPPFAADLVAALQAAPGRRWSGADLAARGLDPAEVARVFRAGLGTTFLDLARQTRARAAFGTLRQDGQVLDAPQQTAFASAEEFRAALARLLGRAPGGFTGDEPLKADTFDTPLGPMIAVADGRALHLLEFLDRHALAAELRRLQAGTPGGIGPGRTALTGRAAAELGRYFAGGTAAFTLPLAFHGSEFTRAVWSELCRIPAGETRSYGELARALGRPEAARAVARANGANQIAILVPCHRVIGAGRALTGYGAGLWRKERLLALEARASGRAEEAGAAAAGRR